MKHIEEHLKSSDKPILFVGKGPSFDLKDKILLSLTSNEKKLESLFKLHYMLNAAKMVIIDKLEQAKSIGTFLETENGLQTTAPEGFVAVDRISNNALKLVNRLEFSKANFTVSKDWVKG